MKFPTTTRVLPELVLTQSERERYSLKARVLIEDAIGHYETFTRVHKRRLNRAQWRVAKKREGLTVYRERRRYQRQQQQGGHHGDDDDDHHGDPGVMPESLLTPSTVRSTMSQAMRASSNPFHPSRGSEPLDEWKLPTLLMVGSIVGTLDDVMYGVATFDAPSMLLKTTYTHDELLDGEVLSQIQGPSHDDPFRFLGIKWIVKGTPPGMRKFMRPRDLVFLEATGVESRWNGERYGYHLMHSEELDGFGPLPGSAGVLRGRLQACTVYRQLANGTVDVYMKANFDPNGSVRESFALTSAANGLSHCWRAVVCAQNKKLAWMLTQSQERARVAAEVAAALSGAIPPNAAVGVGSSRRVQGKNVCCSVCRKSANRFRHMVSCELCQGPMCSKCRVTKKLSCTGGVAWRRKEITQRDVLLCKSCVASSSKADAFEIARAEVVSGKWDLAADISIMPMPSRSSSRASSIYEPDGPETYRHRRSEKALSAQRRESDATSFNRTLKLSLARIDANEEFASSGHAPLPLSSAPTGTHDWAGSFDSNAGGDDDDDDELEQEYYFDEQGRASEVPRASYASNASSSTAARLSANFVDCSDRSSEYRYSRPLHFVDLMTPDVVSEPVPAPVVAAATAPEPESEPTVTELLVKERSRSASSPPKFRDHPRSLSNVSSASTQTNVPSGGVRFSLDPSLTTTTRTSAQPEPASRERQPSQQQQQQSRHEEMWKQMLQLRDAAEHVYQVTRHNSEVHARGSRQVWPSVRG